MVPACVTGLVVPPTSENRTPTVQLAPGASVVPVQVSLPRTTLKSHTPPVKDAPAPATATPVTVKLAPVVAADVFVSVTVPVPVVVPVGREMDNGLGVIDTAARAATPVPVSVTGDPVTVAPV